ncbi:hypothetical protein ITP53_11320 [Nonomuraea sp. K274]|uniref:Uncharacterized protein n=1 Tax=Nonomuraea cypriaca TaxID=1187855 RepID=A0A931A709_9ACTN|nr:hypothetical protein [Nonomuraea cypriaca]MBF8186328.1 hypothetical protein [Nonomuraea cypriaca]
MSEQPPEGMSQRFADTPESALVSAPATYSAQAEGPVRRRALRDEPGGRVLGHVWTDDQRAAGWLHADPPNRETSRAGAYVWAVHRRAYSLGRPASSLLDPSLYAPMYYLDSE